jgi:creatinine amidohydrolase/Fe(II)-dependent formamide hydrolase-like protein
MNIFLRSLTVGLIPLAMLALAAAAPDSRVLIEEMTTAEVRDAINAGKTTVLIFSGSTEESGPHLVLGKHTFRARYLGERIARELGNTLVAPVLPFAPARPLMGFPGTINLSPETFSQVNEEVADSMVKAGFKYIILMGDHGGNQKPLELLAPKLDEKYRSLSVRVFYAGDVYIKSGRESEAYLKEHAFPPSGHAGITDTSELWAVSGKYVRREKIAMGEPMPPPGSPILSALGTTGVEGDPRKSSQKLGRMFMEWRVKNAVAEIRNLIQNSAVK